MAVKRKNSPSGIDAQIDKAQVYFSSMLTFSTVGATNEWFPRIYSNPFEKGRNRNDFQKKPEHFVIGSANEYEEVFNNDSVDIQSYWVAEPVEELDPITNEMIRRVSLVFMLNLKKLYPAISHRGDEEFKMAVYNAWKSWPLRKRFYYVSCETETENVFREFMRDKINFEDMHPRHCVRFNFDVNYVPECCTDC